MIFRLEAENSAVGPRRLRDRLSVLGPTARPGAEQFHDAQIESAPARPQPHRPRRKRANFTIRRTARTIRLYACCTGVASRRAPGPCSLSPARCNLPHAGGSDGGGSCRVMPATEPVLGVIWASFTAG